MKDKHCTKCGEKLLSKTDDQRNWLKSGWSMDKFYPDGSKIDYSGTKYTCPKERWWNSHDKYFVRSNPYLD